MKKKALVILMTAVLAFSGVLSPAMAAAAEENTQEAEDTQEEADAAEEKSLLEQGTQIGEDLYKKMDEAVDGIDKKSLRRSIGIRDAQNAVQKRTEGFFTVLWDGFLDTIESIITNGISIFSGLEGSGDKGGKGL